MPTNPFVHDFFNGDTTPAAPDAGFVGVYFLNGRPTMRRSTGETIDLMPRFVVPLVFFGEAAVNDLFGKHIAAEPCRVTLLELDAQEAPTDAALTVELVNGSGTSFSPARTVTIAAGAKSGRADITDLDLAAADTLQAKITAVGSTLPGANLHLRIFITTK